MPCARGRRSSPSIRAARVVGMQCGRVHRRRAWRRSSSVCSPRRALPARCATSRCTSPPTRPRSRPDRLAFPGKVAVDGDRIAIADSGHHRVLVGTLEEDGRRMRVERVIGSGDAGLRRWRRARPSDIRRASRSVTRRSTSPIPATTPSAPSSLANGTCAPSPVRARSFASARDRATGALSSPWDLALARRHAVRRDGRHPSALDAGSAQRDGRAVRAELAPRSCTTAHMPKRRSPSRWDSALAGDALLVADAESSAVREVDLDPDGRGAHDRRHRPVRLRDVDGVGDAGASPASAGTRRGGGRPRARLRLVQRLATVARPEGRERLDVGARAARARRHRDRAARRSTSPIRTRIASR